MPGVTEVAGVSAAGKTQLCLQLCLTAQLPREHGGLDAGPSVMSCSQAVHHACIHMYTQLIHIHVHCTCTCHSSIVGYTYMYTRVHVHNPT